MSEENVKPETPEAKPEESAKPTKPEAEKETTTDETASAETSVEEADEKVEVKAEKDTLDAKAIDEEKTAQENIQKKVDESVAIWTPKTELGKLVKAGTLSDIDELFKTGKPILEVEIIDTLFPNLESDLLLIGQSKGKFGGGARRVFKQTQKKTKEGNKPSFATMAVVGNKDGYVGVGYAKARETVPAREKALRKAKLNLFSVSRGSGSWQSSSREPHTIPFKVEGRCGSTRITLMPAPVGKGLIIEKECKKILELAGIKDVWSKTSGQTKTKINLIKACVSALQQLNDIRVTKKQQEELAIIRGSKKSEE